MTDSCFSTGMNKGVIQSAVGIILLILILYEIDVRSVIKAIGGVDPPRFLLYFILAAVSHLFYNLFMGYRLFYLVRKMGRGVSFADAFFAHTGGRLASDVTPGRSGYLLTPYFLKEMSNDENCTLSDGMAAIIAPQGIEFILKVLGGFLGFLFFLSFIGKGIMIPMIMACCAFLFVGALLLWTMWTREESTEKIISRIPLVGKFGEVYSGIKYRSFSIKKYVHVILILYMVCWIFTALQWFFIAKSLEIEELTFLACFLLHPLITLLSFVPITPAGIGIMEGGLIGVFYMLGVDVGSAFSFSIIARLNMIAVNLIGLRSAIPRRKTSKGL